MSRALLFAPLLAAALIGPGCASGSTTSTAPLAHPMLGSNVADREPADRPLWARALLYVPDRLLDLGDVFSFDVHLGVGVLANLHFTRAVQVGAGLREVAGVGWHEQRSLGFQIQGDAQMLLPGFGAEAGHVGTLGTSGVNSASESTAGIIEPTDPLYQDYRDYWAVGGQVTAVFVGVDFDLHPVQLADFFAGWFGIDFLRDDFGRSRARTDADRAPVEPAGEVEFDDAGSDPFPGEAGDETVDVAEGEGQGGLVAAVD